MDAAARRDKKLNHGSFQGAREGSDASQKLDRKDLPERENFNDPVFALAFFSGRQDRELLGAISRGLLDCPCRL